MIDSGSTSFPHRSFAAGGRLLAAHEPRDDNQRDPAQIRSIAMVSGAAWADWWVCMHSQTIAALRHYRLGGLLSAGFAARPLGDVARTFASTREFHDTASGSGLGVRIAQIRDTLAAGTLGFRATSCRALSHWKRSWPSLRHGLRRRASRWRFLRDAHPWLGEFDIVHWHSADPERLEMVELLPAGCRLALSFMGTDLWSPADPEGHLLQAMACDRADVIAVGSAEMAAVVMAKWGRRLQSKIRRGSYPFVNLTGATHDGSGRERFRERCGADGDQLLICVGNNGSRNNQHLAVLGEIDRLDARLLDRLIVLLPMAYGRDEAYLSEVRSFIKTRPYRVALLNEYLSADDVQALRASTDIFIHTPISDQFSAAMCESLTAGAILITGAWLPYSRLRVGGVHFHEIAAICDISARLSRIVESFEAERLKCRDNSTRLLDMLRPDVTAREWDETYQALLGRR